MQKHAENLNENPELRNHGHHCKDTSREDGGSRRRMTPHTNEWRSKATGATEATAAAADAHDAEGHVTLRGRTNPRASEDHETPARGGGNDQGGRRLVPIKQESTTADPPMTDTRRGLPRLAY